MAFDDKLLEMLSSNDAQVRIKAIEQVRESQPASEEIIKAVEKASHDENPEVAEKAAQALQNAEHQQMTANTGMIVDQEEDATLSTTNQTPSTGSAHVETPKSKRAKRTSPDIPPPNYVPNWLQNCQAVTFFFSALALITTILESDSSEFLYGDGRIFIFVIMAYFGFQIYAIMKYGFKASFYFLDKLIKFFFSRHR
jgi:hypothetical protein